LKEHDLRHRLLTRAKRIVVKIGSSVLVEEGIGLDLVAFSKLAKEISQVHTDSREIVVVSSGAIAAGMERLGYDKRPQTIPGIQAAAAVGQPHLMKIYQDCFFNYRKQVAQILLTHEDLSNRHRYLNARNTLLALLGMGFIPIVNENDTVAVEEIQFGDNDNLSALVTSLVSADLLIILSDIAGLYDRDPKHDNQAKLMDLVENIERDMVSRAAETRNPWSIGGMASKIEAARKAVRFGVPTLVANGKVDGILKQILDGEKVGTLFLPLADRLSSRKQWIAYGLKPTGQVIVDDGAKTAIVSHGKSLLPRGVVDARGEFDRGDAVSCLDAEGREFGRGLVNYNCQELKNIKGRQSRDIEGIIGYKYTDEIIHRDDLVILQGFATEK
jgi:glutamate 5-kinase